MRIDRPAASGGPLSLCSASFSPKAGAFRGLRRFGAIHNADEKCSWQGPGAWRTDGEEWSEDYVLHRHGVLAQPTVE